MLKTMLFVRDFTSFTGGHLKVFDYLKHVQSSQRVTPVLYLTPGSSRDGNPFLDAGVTIVDAPFQADAFFLGGVDWRLLDTWQIDCSNSPVVNLVQHVRHAVPGDERYPFLSRPALRCCVSPEVRDAIVATGRTQGPVVSIRAGIDSGPLEALRNPAKTHDVFVGGTKNPTLAARLAERLRASGYSVDLVTSLVPRHDFLRRIASARTAIMLPTPTEGFYLPALEAMAIGTPLVVPDAVGNRTFCIPMQTCLLTDFSEESLVAGARELLTHPALAGELATKAMVMAENYTLAQERSAFLSALNAYLDEWRFA